MKAVRLYAGPEVRIEEAPEPKVRGRMGSSGTRVDARQGGAATGPLHPIADDLWMVDGPAVSFYCFAYSTRAVIVRLEGGALWIWSPIKLTPELEAAVRRCGEVRWLVSPNKLHHLFIPAWLRTFESARAFAPPGLARKRPDIRFAGSLKEAPEPTWAEAIDQTVVRGSPVLEEVLFFHRPSSTCLIGDLIQRQEPEAFRGWKRAAMAIDALLGTHGSTPREWRATFVRRAPARRALEKALAWRPRRIVIAHGQCAMAGGSELLAQNLAWIRRPWPL